MTFNFRETVLYHVRIISDKKVFVCSRALARTIDRARAILRTLIITIQPDMILVAGVAELIIELV